jgi:hypothetical protein
MPDFQDRIGYQLFTSWLRFGSGWCADQTVPQLAASHRGSNQRASWPPLLGLGRWEAILAKETTI